MEANKIIVALDGLEPTKALELAEILQKQVWGFKINDLLFADSEMIQKLKKFGGVFADAKLHDIPNTVSNSVQRLSHKGADIITVHSSGGREMIEAAKKAAGQSKIIAVTVLTSKLAENVSEEVIKYAHEAIESGADGIVCSGHELEALNKLAWAHSKIKVVPGVRPSWYLTPDDQKRTVTPKEALDRGADFIVVGRPITQSQDPLLALHNLLVTH